MRKLTPLSRPARSPRPRRPAVARCPPRAAGPRPVAGRPSADCRPGSRPWCAELRLRTAYRSEGKVGSSIRMLRARRRRAVERRHHQVQVDRQRVHHHDLAGQRRRPAAPPSRGTARGTSTRAFGRGSAPRRPAGPVVEFLLDQGARRLGCSPSELPHEVDHGSPSGAGRDVELVAEAGQRVGRVVGAPRAKASPALAGQAKLLHGHEPRNSRALSRREQPLASSSWTRSVHATRSACPGSPLAQRERVVGAQRRPVRVRPPARARLAQGVGVVDQRVDVEPAQVARAGCAALSTAHRSGRAWKPCVDAADRAGERAAAVGEADPQPRQPLQHAAEDQRADRQRRLRRHAHQPGQPVLAPSAPCPACPRGGRTRPRPARCGRLEDREQRRVVEVPVVDVAADLHAAQAQLAGRSAPARGRPGRGPAAAACPGRRSAAGCARTTSAMWSLSSRARSRRVSRLGPVAEHHRHGGQHLHVDAVPVAVLRGGAPGPSSCPRSRGRACRRSSCGRSRGRGAPAGRTRRSRSAARSGQRGGRMCVCRSIFMRSVLPTGAGGNHRAAPVNRRERLRSRRQRKKAPGGLVTARGRKATRLPGHSIQRGDLAAPDRRQGAIRRDVEDHR